ncbi:MAG: SpoVG family protein, partial [bacterium]
DHLKAFASITLDETFAVRDLKIVEGERGLFVSMPARRDNAGKYRDVAHPVTREFYDALQARVLEAYRRAAEAAPA